MTPDVQVCNTVYEPQCTTVQDEKCEIRYEDKCETKYEVNIIQFGGGEAITGYIFIFRTNVKQSMTLYAEMFRYFVKIFCKLKLTVSVCRTRSAKHSRRPNVIRN